jgi:hypothetical protein
MTEPDSFAPQDLRPGDLVEVRSEEEILATLDASGTIGGLPFMPEMLAYCGKRFRVNKRADKTCDTINYSGARRMLNAVHLENLRCDGGRHGGCQAQCSIFWKEAWLKRVDGSNGGRADRGGSARAAQPGLSRERLQQLTERPERGEGGEVRYRCQATDLLTATSPLRTWDVRQYLRDVRSGNVGIAALVRAFLFRVFLKTHNLIAYRLQISLYNKLQAWRGGTPYPYLAGTRDKTPHATLDLVPGEYVRVKSHAQILDTVNERRRNRGLSFDPEMVRYCGRVHRVRARVERIIDEKTGKMTALASDCIILENAICHAEYSPQRLFCPRQLYPFWREIWLERVAAPAAMGAAEQRDAPAARPGNRAEVPPR